MKSALWILALVSASSASASTFECEYSNVARDGGAASIRLVKGEEGVYSLELKTSGSPMAGKSSQNVTYRELSCDVSKTILGLFTCSTPEILRSVGIEGNTEIVGTIGYSAYLRETLIVSVDPDQELAKAGVVPKIPEIRVPLASCQAK